MTDAILDLDDVKLSFATPFGPALGLRGVSLEIGRGSIVALVGESGCGKTMTGRAIMRLLPANAAVTGRVVFEGQNLLDLPLDEMQRMRGAKLAMIFQDPATALNPVFTIGQQIDDVLRHHHVVGNSGLRARALELLSEVGLPDPKYVYTQYPHELSGGMQQRATIAIALSASPRLLIADEPTTSLDVTIQAQILDLLLRLQATHGITVVLITHNMFVVRRACQRVAVLYAGRVVEEGSVDDVLRSPQHPYTEALLASLPSAVGRRMPLKVIPGLLPNTGSEIVGCVFAPRCPYKMPVCDAEMPSTTFPQASHSVACWLRQDSTHQ